MISRLFLHYENPNKRDIAQIVDSLRNNHIFIIPTDTVYALCCLWTNKKGIDRIVKIMGKKEKHLKLSLICRDIQMASEYAMPIGNKVFRTINRLVPGPYTFILESNIKIQRVFRSSKKEIGIRIPDHKILTSLIEELQEPLITTSLNKDDPITPYFTDPDEIVEEFKNDIDYFIDGGILPMEESTVLNCMDGEINLVRKGKGQIEELLYK